MRETFKSSFADFDQSNFFANQNKAEQKLITNKDQGKDKEKEKNAQIEAK